jgi:hypothetical protein
MKSVHRTTICTLVFLAMLGAAFAQKVQTDFDRKANFSQYKTYSWREIKSPNSLWDARIKSAVDAQLAAKGWTQVDSGGDVAIVATKTTGHRGASHSAATQTGATVSDQWMVHDATICHRLGGTDCGTGGMISSAATQTGATVSDQWMAHDATICYRLGGTDCGTGDIISHDDETLAVDLYDAKTKRLIWRGSIEDTLSDETTQNEKNLDKSVAKMFKGFPTSSAKS